LHQYNGGSGAGAFSVATWFMRAIVREKFMRTIVREKFMRAIVREKGPLRGMLNV
jgi:hypothetical protein